MMFALLFAHRLVAVLLALVTFVQLLYLESLRLRTRDCPRSDSSRRRWKTARL